MSHKIAMDKQARSRAGYPYLQAITTRWMDNDVYGHVNNVNYYSYFDSVVNQFLIERGGLDIHAGEMVGFIVESRCQYLSPVAFPERLEGALRTAKIGNSSVTYELAIFKQSRDEAVALGQFTHVFVRRADNQPVAIPTAIRQALESIQLN